MQYNIIPCVEGDDELIADKLNAITDSKIVFEDTIKVLQSGLWKSVSIGPERKGAVSSPATVNLTMLTV